MMIPFLLSTVCSNRRACCAAGPVALDTERS
jgi:hypothetical protein